MLMTMSGFSGDAPEVCPLMRVKLLCFIFTSFALKLHPERILLLLKDGSKLPNKLHLAAASTAKSGDKV